NESSALQIFFFVSSRRRHTRFSRDWSSDVCSSDLEERHVTALTVEEVTPTPANDVIVAVPRHFSEVPPDTDISETERGAAALGLPLLPQGINEARLFGARDPEGGALYRTCVVQMPRRATKSTSIWATIIGRALTRPKYKCVVTAQSGTVPSPM